MKLLAQQNIDGAINYDSYNTAIGLKTNLAGGSLGSIISFFLPYILTLAGLILFGMLVAGGFSMLVGAADKEAQEKGKAMITNALLGFVLVFFTYWIAQILQIIFNVSIVN